MLVYRLEIDRGDTLWVTAHAPRSALAQLRAATATAARLGDPCPDFNPTRGRDDPPDDSMVTMDVYQRKV